jgi:hypothetical protein
MFKDNLLSDFFAKKTQKKEQGGTPRVAALTLRDQVPSTVSNMSRWPTGCDGSDMALLSIFL